MTERRPPRFDFSPFEGRYPRVFAMLREQGWTSQRFVEIPDIELEASRDLVLTDFPRAFLHSFFGLELAVKQPWGERRVLFGYDGRLKNLMIDDYVNRLDGFCDYAFPYPVLTWDTMFGFATERGDAFAVDDFYQVFARGPDPFRLAEYALFREGGRGLETGYLERKNMPADYWHLVWNRPLEYHNAKYKAFAIQEGGRTEYVLENTDYPDLFQVMVSELTESGSVLTAKYRRADSDMPTSVASALVVSKLLGEFFEGTHRDRIHRIVLTDEKTGEVSVTLWAQ